MSARWRNAVATKTDAPRAQTPLWWTRSFEHLGFLRPPTLSNMESAAS